MRARKVDMRKSTGDAFIIDYTVDNEDNLNYTGRFNGTAEINTLTSLVSYGGNVLPMDSFCNNGNCTANLSFAAPSLKCENVSWLSEDAPWYVPPNEVSWDEFGNLDIAGKWRLFDSKIQYTSEQDADGDIWLAWAIYKEENTTYLTDGTPWRSTQSGLGSTVNPKYATPFDVYASKCIGYNTTYDIKVGFRAAVPILDIKTTLIKPYNVSMRKVDGPDLSTAFYDPDFDKPATVQRAKDLTETLRAFGLMDTLYISILAGGISETGSIGTVTYSSSTNIISTRLTRKWICESGMSRGNENVTAFYPIRELSSAVEDLSRNIPISMLARPNLVFKSQAEIPCTLLRDLNVYEFDVGPFWASYGTGLVLAMCTVIAGILSMFSAVRARESTFSSIAAAMMDRRIDDIVRDVPPEKAAETRLTNVKVKLDWRFQVRET